jgi:hypothetical protein
VIQTQAESRLRKSLKFLLGYPADQFPVASIDYFKPADYYGHDNFNILGSDDRYLSEKLSIVKSLVESPLQKIL